MTPLSELLAALKQVADSLPATLDDRFPSSDIRNIDRHKYDPKREQFLQEYESLSKRFASRPNSTYLAKECTQILSENDFSIFSDQNIRCLDFIRALSALLFDLERTIVKPKSKLISYYCES